MPLLTNYELLRNFKCSALNFGENLDRNLFGSILEENNENFWFEIEWKVQRTLVSQLIPFESKLIREFVSFEK